MAGNIGRLDLESLKVNELRDFLAKRGVNSHCYNKGDLLLLARNAIDIDLPVLSAIDDHNKVQFCKRFVILGQTVYQLPHISGLTDGWMDDLSSVPDLEMSDVLVYLYTRCGWSQERLKTFKEDGAFQLFTSGHVHGVITRAPFRLGEKDFQYVKGKCVPEQRQSASPYAVWILAEKSGTIQQASCECPAGYVQSQ